MRVRPWACALAVSMLLAAAPLRAEDPDEGLDTVAVLDILAYHPLHFGYRAAREALRLAAGAMIASALIPRCGENDRSEAATAPRDTERTEPADKGTSGGKGN